MKFIRGTGHHPERLYRVLKDAPFRAVAGRRWAVLIWWKRSGISTRTQIVRICLGAVAAILVICIVGAVGIVVVGLVSTLGWWIFVIPPAAVLLGAIGYVVGRVAERWPS